jgi:hypothetical protein
VLGFGEGEFIEKLSERSVCGEGGGGGVEIGMKRVRRE